MGGPVAVGEVFCSNRFHMIVTIIDRVLSVRATNGILTGGVSFLLNEGAIETTILLPLAFLLYDPDEEVDFIILTNSVCIVNTGLKVFDAVLRGMLTKVLKLFHAHKFCVLGLLQHHLSGVWKAVDPTRTL